MTRDEARRRLAQLQAEIREIRRTYPDLRRTTPIPEGDLRVQAVALYDCDFSIRQVGDELGLSYTATRRLLLAAGVALRAAGTGRAA